MTDKNKITEDDFLSPITKLQALAVLFGHDELEFQNGKGFGVTWMLGDIVKELEAVKEKVYN